MQLIKHCHEQYNLRAFLPKEWQVIPMDLLIVIRSRKNHLQNLLLLFEVDQMYLLTQLPFDMNGEWHESTLLPPIRFLEKEHRSRFGPRS